MKRTNDLISRAAAIRAAVISVRDYYNNIDIERDICIEEGLDEVLAVDAIPVKWLKRQRENELMLFWEDGWGRGNEETFDAINDVLEMWEKRKEKINGKAD